MYQSFKTKEKISLPITVNTFELILSYMITVRNINRKFTKNVQRIMEVINRKPYEHDDYQIFILDAVSFVAELRASGINNIIYIKDALDQSNLNHSFVKDFIKTIEKNPQAMTKEEYDHLGSVVRDYADYIQVYLVRPIIMQCYDDLMSANGRVTTKKIQELKSVLEDTLTAIRLADAARDSEQAICLDPTVNKNIKNDIRQLHESITDPCNLFITGLKELNRFLNGGYKRKRMYIYYAPTNSFKSGILLYNTLWICKFNPNVKPKFPNKKLCILYFTMENDKEETMDRIHAIFTEGQIDPRNISAELYDSQWNNTIIPNINSNFRIYIKYHAPGITVPELQGIVDELEEDEDNEVAAVIIDHLGNIGKSNKSSDDRKGLIDSAYELSNWAKTSDRLIITAMHTNSTFDDKLAEAQEGGKSNLVKMMGRWCIADAKYIDRAVDQSLYMLKEFSPFDGSWYLGMKYEKVRQRKSQGSNVFYHKLDNEITLHYDVGTPGCYSYPCVPGTENSMGMMKNTPPASQNGFAGQNHQSQAQIEPFSAGNSVPQTASKFQTRFPPVQMAVNENTPFNIEGFSGLAQEIEDEFEDIDFLKPDNDVLNLMSSIQQEQDFEMQEGFGVDIVTQARAAEEDDGIDDDDFTSDEDDPDFLGGFADDDTSSTNLPGAQ